MKYVTIIATLVAICNCKIVEISEKNLLINKANDAKAEDMDWYKNAVIYQVYPRSFFDTNGDGIGDIKGKEILLKSHPQSSQKSEQKELVIIFGFSRYHPEIESFQRPRSNWSLVITNFPIAHG